MVETTFPRWQLFHVFLRETMHKHTIWYSVVMLLGVSVHDGEINVEQDLVQIIYYIYIDK